jgi:hypothetical protein
MRRRCCLFGGTCFGTSDFDRFGATTGKEWDVQKHVPPRASADKTENHKIKRRRIDF